MKGSVIDSAFTRTSLYGSTHEPTYSGALSFLRRAYRKELDGIDFAITGVPLDTATTNRPGTRFGPAGIRAASAQLAWGPPWPWGFDPTERAAMIDYGDCLWDHGKPDAIPAAIEAHAATIIEHDVEMITMGGDHYITLPLMRAQFKKHGPLSMVHFDAHSDTWEDNDQSRVDHGTMFYQALQEGIIDPATSVQIGIRTHNSNHQGIEWLDAAFVHDRGVQATLAETLRIVGSNKAYLTFDIDCLDPSVAPGTGTPVVGGLTLHQAQSIIRGLGSINFIAMDLVEVAPAYDTAEITSLAGASLIVDYLCMRTQTWSSRV